MMDYENGRKRAIMFSNKNKSIESFLCQTFNAVILAGIIILLMGIYYCAIKAGIPYQDPPLELQIQYAINMGIGENLIKNGVLIAVCGILVRLFLKLALNKIRKVC